MIFRIQTQDGHISDHPTMRDAEAVLKKIMNWDNPYFVAPGTGQNTWNIYENQYNREREIGRVLIIKIKEVRNEL